MVDPIIAPPTQSPTPTMAKTMPNVSLAAQQQLIQAQQIQAQKQAQQAKADQTQQQQFAKDAQDAINKINLKPTSQADIIASGINF